MRRAAEVVYVQIDGIPTIGFEPCIQRSHGLTPQPSELFDSFAVLIAPQIEPEEHPGALGVESIPYCELLPEIFFHFAKERGLYALRIAFRRRKENMPFVKVHLFPGCTEQLSFAPTDIVVNNKKQRSA